MHSSYHAIAPCRRKYRFAYNEGEAPDLRLHRKDSFLMKTVLCYDRCSTCRKALKWLDEHSIAYKPRDIAGQNPSREELEAFYKASGLPLTRFLNTSRKKYRDLNLKDQLKTMSEAEMLDLLASDGMLVKRPILSDGRLVLVGFKEADWSDALL
jgi:arsenate reductase